MAEKTEISWTDATFNPWMGCTKVGPGCDNCYAEELMDHRYGKVIWGVGAERVRTGVKNWNLPKRWNSQHWHECTACGLRGLGTAHGYSRICTGCSQETLKPARRRVFCSSLADVFDNAVDPAWRADLFRLICDTPNLDWLLLTKRPGNIMPMLREVWRLSDAELERDVFPKILKHVWFGATIVNQEEADRDIPKLLAVPARVRFLSMEPLLGPVDLRLDMTSVADRLRVADEVATFGLSRRQTRADWLTWVIVGGESGKNARPMNPDWVRSLGEQCEVAGVAFHFKQHGEWAPVSGVGGGQEHHYFDGNVIVRKVGKKAAGRELDGRTHNEFPRVTP